VPLAKVAVRALVSVPFDLVVTGRAQLGGGTSKYTPREEAKHTGSVRGNESNSASSSSESGAVAIVSGLMRRSANMAANLQDISARLLLSPGM
jgi:hypothetical protein